MDRNENIPESNIFIENMVGGAFVFRAYQSHELVCVNQKLVEFYECRDKEEFMDFVEGSFDGMINITHTDSVLKEIEVQIKENSNSYGYVFFHIRTKKGNVRRVVNHWTFVPAKGQNDEDLVYCFLFLHRLDNVGSDLDGITSLIVRRPFLKYVSNRSRNSVNDQRDYVIVYLNLINFKLLNLEKGVDEGDACLKILAEMLKEVYRGALVARVAGDHFAVFDEYEGIKEKTEIIEKKFCETYGNRFNTRIKFGIFRFRLDPSLDVEQALSRAKVACDYIKQDMKADISEYSEELAKNVRTREYVVNKIEDAIENGWIKVYYQPVIRTLTGWLCGMESLVRWIDPEYGLLSPDQFIPTLEKEHCIHKLDCYVVEQVCKCIHDRVEAGLPMVPVSVNFSRLDFTMCDMLEVVESCVVKYDIPRDYIHIEITESMFVSDAGLIEKVMGRFQDAGYEVWMDDFGSGYSSLNMLKDYHFDTLKLDMNFLKPFTDRSRTIVRSAVNMVKSISIRTLAEGVETREQLDFLRDIGCGMIQGYYYGKPEPVDLVFKHLKEKNIEIETRKWRHFYEVASFNIISTDSPLEIIEYDGENFKTLFMNRSYREQIFNDINLDLSEIDQVLYRRNSALLKRYREFVDQLKRTRKEETFYYTIKGYYYCLKARVLVENDGHFIIRGNLTNITNNTLLNVEERIDSRIRDMNMLFDEILIVDIKENSLNPLLGRFRFIFPNLVSKPDLQKSINVFAENAVFPPEKERYLRFFDISTLKERVEKEKRGYIEDVFRIKQEDGSYVYNEMFILMISGTDGNEFIYCMKPLTEKRENSYTFENFSNEVLSYHELFDNILFGTGICFCFKDIEGKYFGASNAFVEYFGFRSLGEIINKTTTEVLEIIDKEDFVRQEAEVLKKGVTLHGIYAQCIVKGRIKNISYSKMPLYKDGKIVGLACMVTDIDMERRKAEMEIGPLTVDSLTGLMNGHAFMDTIIDFAELYLNKKTDYGIILLMNRNHKRIEDTYGKEFSNMILVEIAARLRKAVGEKAVIARMKDNIFGILQHVDSKEQLDSMAGKIEDEVNRIKELDGNRTTIRLKVAVRLRSMEKESDEEMYEKALREIKST